MEKLKGKIDFETIIFLLSIVLVGGFFEEVSCLLTVLLSVAIFITAKKNKCLNLKINAIFVTGLTVVAGYLLSTIWAVDSGMAFLGFVKYLPILLFIILVSQNEELREKLLKTLPFFAVGVTVITVILMQIPPLRAYFSVADRFAGCFQYPNTFAIFLLVSELLLISKDRVKIVDLIFAVVLFGGILYTGSRAVFVLAVLSNAVLLIFGKNKKLKLCFIGVCAVGIIAAVFVTVVAGPNVFGRFLSISLKESTFVGRLLYFKDALPVILEHPFGLGCNGHYYIQQTIQTGVYSVRYVHNDFLQLALDIGWIPVILLVATIVLTLFNKNVAWQRKVILMTLVLHSCFDFNLQYISMWFILILLVDTNKQKIFEVKTLPLATILLTVVSIISIYFGIAVSAYRYSANTLAKKMYPYYTDNNIELLKKCDVSDSMNVMADSILKQNEYVSVCYSAKAKVAYSHGNFKDLIDYKHKVFKYAPFSYSDYEEYCYMLINGISLYSRNGDQNSVNICKKELIETSKRLEVLPEKLSYLGTLIKDQPKTDLPEDILKVISEISTEK